MWCTSTANSYPAILIISEAKSSVLLYLSVFVSHYQSFNKNWVVGAHWGHLIVSQLIYMLFIFYCNPTLEYMYLCFLFLGVPIQNLDHVIIKFHFLTGHEKVYSAWELHLTAEWTLPNVPFEQVMIKIKVMQCSIKSNTSV